MAVALSITQIYLKIVYAFVFHEYVIIVYLNLSTELEHVYACNITSPQGFWGKDEYPNPRKDVNYCGRNCTKSWVCDPAGILTSHQADDLDRTLDRIATSGNCRCTQCTSNEGHYIYVALMSRMKISEGQTEEMEAYAFSEHLKEKWMGGTCGNIVVIVVSTEDKQMPTNPGSEASAILTLECIKLIYNEVKPLVKTRGYYSALKSMIRRYNETLYMGQCPVKETLTESSTSSSTVFKILFVCFIVILPFSAPLAVCGILLLKEKCKNNVICKKFRDRFSCACCGNPTYIRGSRYADS